MIKKYCFGSPFETNAVIEAVPLESSPLPYFSVASDEKLEFTLKLLRNDAVYGLGEASRGINKRGYIYDSYCTDDPNHTEATRSLYGAHSFIVIESKANTFGAFFDCPSRVTFDVSFTKYDTLTVSSDNKNMYVYIVEGKSIYDIVKRFRKAIGQSYMAPMWAFGYTQSRWSYMSKEEVKNVADKYHELGIPLDAIYLDIDYMERYKDFTVNKETFGDLKAFAEEMKEQGVRLVPIIDAGVKIEEGYSVYEEGVEKGYFCTDSDGKPYALGVWPGLTHFPDFLNPDASRWFGDKYKILTDMGIDGFWNDMNEPAIFYSQRGLEAIYDKMKKYSAEEPDIDKFYEIRDMVGSLANSQDDYNSFYHNTTQGRVLHNDVHNLYGYNMTKSAGESLARINPDKRFLLFSRASYIGMHRYSGIWTGDNHSWWSHILNEIRVLPSLNMCGFLYAGADMGGFGCDASRDLMLRWLALGIFTPLLRNHSAQGTRVQEFFRFEDTDDFRYMVELRYRLIPYLYSEYMKAALNDEMYFKPLAFEYPDDETARHTEDQLLIGNEIMIAPVYTQNSIGRYVYLPEDMTAVKMSKGILTETQMKKGHHFIEVAEDEVVFFIRSGKAIPLCKPAMNTSELDLDTLELIGEGNEYTLFFDGGDGKDFANPDNYRTLKK
ncbi:MAG: TIM-barrel domain-containing protein [Ruminococcus sp.]